MVKKILLVLLIIFIIAQFFGPDKNQGDPQSVEAFLSETKPNAEVTHILKETCFDCHSAYTRYPWYDKITPVNFWLANHVEEGKDEFNVSEWSSYSPKKKDHKLEELIEMVEEKEMPLPSYTWTHREADLTSAQIESMVSWAKSVRETIQP